MVIIKEQIDIFLMEDFNARMQNRKGESYDLEAPEKMALNICGELENMNELTCLGGRQYRRWKTSNKARFLTPPRYLKRHKLMAKF